MSIPSAAKSSRRDRLAAALRENLKRRKGQAKARTAAAGEPGERTKPHDSAGIPADNHTGSR
ncbi:MAG TPA: hypothetical protein VH684_09605 [Xanthobacteraceae bacterium]